MNHGKAVLFPMILTFVVATVLEMVVMKEIWQWMRPYWLLIVVMYWRIKVPEVLNVIVVWLLGIMLDTLSGSLLGQHAFAFLIIIYVIHLFYMRIRLFPPIQQGLVVMLLCFIYAMINACVLHMTHQVIASGLYWLAPILSAVIWLIMSHIFNRRQSGTIFK